WISELARPIKDELPNGYRAYLGSGPAVAIGAPPLRPDLSVRSSNSSTTTTPELGQIRQRADESESSPDLEVAVASLEVEPSLLIELDGRLVAAVELISPRHKDRPVARTNYGRRYAGYLMEGVNLLLI